MDETGEPENISRAGFLPDDSMPDAVRKYIKFALKRFRGLRAGNCSTVGFACLPSFPRKQESSSKQKTGRAGIFSHLFIKKAGKDPPHQSALVEQASCLFEEKKIFCPLFETGKMPVLPKTKMPTVLQSPAQWCSHKGFGVFSFALVGPVATGVPPVVLPALKENWTLTSSLIFKSETGRCFL